MALKEDWKKTGKDVGTAFADLGKSLGKTAKVVFTDDENKVEENGHTELGNKWKKTGKDFGEAGKSFGKASLHTAQKVVNCDDKKANKDIKKDEAIDVEIIEDKK